MKHLAVDCGRCTVVTVGPKDYRDLFPAYVGEPQELNLKNKFRETDIILFTQFGSFFIGDLAMDESHGSGRLMTENKVHQDTKALILAAVARAVNDGDEVKLTTGLPVKLHKDPIKKAISDLLLGSHTVILNSVKKTFHICRINVGVEGPSAYTVLCKGLGGTVRFIDLGSRMMNFGTIQNGRYINKESGSLDYGCDTVDGDIVHRVVSDLSAKWSSFDLRTYVFGGGAKKHSDGLSRYFPKLLCAVNPLYTTALALYAIGGGDGQE